MQSSSVTSHNSTFYCERYLKYTSQTIAIEIRILNSCYEQGRCNLKTLLSYPAQRHGSYYFTLRTILVFLP